MIKNIFTIVVFICINCNTIFSQTSAIPSISIPIEGNSWFTPKQNLDRINLSRQLKKWVSNEQVLKTYFHVNKTGKLALYVNFSKVNESTDFEINAFGNKKNINIKAGTERLKLGDFEINKLGYYAIEMQKKSNTTSPVLVDYEIEADKEMLSTINYVKNNEGNFFYWGRRGPSVHMAFELPKNTSITYFYNEIVVPEGNDVIGSYFMANGFSEGYFGIQVNSPTERRILFSVWSPFNTDNPKDIPESHKIKLLAKGSDVYTGEFGNEGSGGQSYLKYNWKAGVSYKFLLKGEPVSDNYTEYTAWFFAPELNEWRLIAKFARPMTNTYLKGFHSFLENFLPEQGDVARKVYFNNQWVRSNDGNWSELTKGRFTVDGTGNKAYRLDFAGGVEDQSFFLYNCGFINNNTKAHSIFERQPLGKQPNVNFDSLPH